MSSSVTVLQSGPGCVRVVLDNPPLNLFDPDLVADLQHTMTRLEADESVKVVVFESANADYFIAHVDVARADQFDVSPQPSTGLASWPDLAARMERAPFLTVASVRGRARGVGSEFLLAVDVRFASREHAIFCQPEVGFGFIPGGGGLERLPLNTGRARALEIVVGAMDYDADTAERYGWINRSIPDAELDGFVEAFVGRVARFDRAAIAAAKRVINDHGGLPERSWITPTEQTFFGLFGTGPVQARVQRFLTGGLQQEGSFELNLADSIAGPLQ